MYGRFQYITEPYRVSLVPFGGDISISMKWDMAKKLEQIYTKYHKPIKVLYAGDCDKKGEEIPKSALRNINAWCKVPFDFIPIVLTLEQAKRFNLPEQPDKREKFQWEALSEQQARQIIIEALEQHVKPVSSEILEKEKTVKATLHPFFVETLNGARARL
jgi:hypothetical protein